ncbi:type ISP restriction/modification enzyme [Aestuariivirga sp.]|uniref:type ISP restriction/modification enzyme n=1 Tax=Aestuariivirga sp. TaxID=2650926 RepID=UPI0035AF5F72
MSQHLINQYLSDLDRLKKVSGVLNEMTVREAFKDLLKAWSRQADLVFAAELEFRTRFKTPVAPDGTILHSIRVPLGYWEAKDTKDDLDEEIAKKTAKGYPQSNIVYENGHTAVLIQNRQEVMRCDMTDPQALLRLVTLFFSYEREEIAEFRRAVEQFKTDLPAVLEALREQIDIAYESNEAFQHAARKFLRHAKDTINPTVSEADVREMLIQHILTEEIFAHVFDQSDFHRENNIAKELYALESQFFTGATKRATLKALEPYYAAIRSNAAAISSHSEKQSFLKAIYESFYKVYNPKAADRLGVVYTPNEIVRFMIDGADWLCKKHFGKHLIDSDVEILDPATGTGTFICELLEHFRGQPQKLAHKYKNELHANEVAILPYYVANLNIEATYAAITGQFSEFPNLCFVDTLDNVAGLGIRAGHQHDLFAALSEENVERVKRQNRRKISVIIGNPPYNAWQDNYNSRNPNRPYRRIDERIAATYIKRGTAQNKNSVYDMYTRFFRWASDRLHDDGIIAFVTNRNLIEKLAFDGFRRAVADEFKEIWLMDLGGDVRANPKLSGTKHNVFGIQTGVTITLMVKNRKQQDRRIYYAGRPEFETADEKLSFLGASTLAKMVRREIEPDQQANWLNQSANDFLKLLCAVPPRRISKVASLFSVTSNGLQTKRDEWVYDYEEEFLTAKILTLTEAYERRREGLPSNLSIKWDRELERHLIGGVAKSFVREQVIRCAFRPFVNKFLYRDKHLNSQNFRLKELFPRNIDNPTIAYLGISSANPFTVLAVKHIFDLCLLKNGNGSTQGLSRWRYAEDGSRIDNITDWGLKQFQARYEKREKPKRRIGKDDIFHYVYGVLHDPIYRETYAINLKREFPRIPFYPDFWAWAAWGQRLMALHIGYEDVEPWPLVRHDLPEGESDPVPKLKAEKDNGTIVLDTRTTLSGVPAVAWTYRLGNRSAIEWVLDQYKEKKPKDPTIAAKFNAYRFKDYKEKVVDLLARVTRVSVETMEIVRAMASAKRE